jgi:membrane peptidoglycan carboxypeptidase
VAVDRSDAAHAFVVAANRKERSNQKRAAQRKERSENQHPAWFFGFAALSVGLVWMYIDKEKTGLAAVWAVIAVGHALLGSRQHASLRRLAENRDADARCNATGNRE